MDSLYDLTAELLNISAKCPDKAAQIRSSGYHIANIIDGIGEMSTYEDRLSSMLGRLTEEGCDEKDILVLGENSLPPGTDADAAQDGANFTEVPGDGEDNDFDAISDEPRYTHPGMNVVFIIGDWGNLKDDVFELVIGMNDKVARTNKADRVEIPRKMDPGTYTATATVISAPDNAGTMYFLVYENGGRIAPPVKGTWPEGASVSVTFTVTGSN